MRRGRTWHVCHDVEIGCRRVAVPESPPSGDVCRALCVCSRARVDGVRGAIAGPTRAHTGRQLAGRCAYIDALGLESCANGFVSVGSSGPYGSGRLGLTTVRPVRHQVRSRYEIARCPDNRLLGNGPIALFPVVQRGRRGCYDDERHLLEQAVDRR